MRRREFLARAGLAIGGFVMGALAGRLSQGAHDRTTDRTTDRAADRTTSRFSGRVSIPEGFTVPTGQTWEFDPNRTTTVEVAANVIVDGTLRMRPASAGIVHTLRFVGVDEAGFVGGGMDPIPTDVGLWVRGSGRLDLVGSSKRAWMRAAETIPSGSSSLTVDEDPRGWRIGDEIAITPTISPSNTSHDAYDVATIASVSGRTITLSTPANHPHPSVPVSPDRTMHAEVLNLTRNVRIEGTPEGRSHVFIRSNASQRISHTTIRYVGPKSLGRYGLHFHMCGEGSRGSSVEGVVIRDCGFHAFVPHASHGVTFRDCIGHDTAAGCYWWDTRDTEEKTHDTLYERCVASRVSADPGDFTNSGFVLTDGLDNAAVGCVAVGIVGPASASGFKWPAAVQNSIWRFEDCIAHNNRGHGIFVWQNGGVPGEHAIDRFIGYYNSLYGSMHGAYRNSYHYRDSILHGNAAGSVLQEAIVTHFTNVTFDAAGLHEDTFQVKGHLLESSSLAQMTDCQFVGYTGSGLRIMQTKFADRRDLVNCTFSGNELWLDADCHPESLITVQDPDGTLAARRFDAPGTFREDWNASVSEVDPSTSSD